MSPHDLISSIPASFPAASHRTTLSEVSPVPHDSPWYWGKGMCLKTLGRHFQASATTMVGS